MYILILSCYIDPTLAHVVPQWIVRSSKPAPSLRSLILLLSAHGQWRNKMQGGNLQSGDVKVHSGPVAAGCGCGQSKQTQRNLSL
jgi:hypothetical protein